MYFPLRVRALASFIALLIFSQLLLATTDIERIHSALFDAFVPFSNEEMDQTVKELVDKARADSFTKIINTPDLSTALSIFNNLHSLHDPLFIKAYYFFLSDEPEEAQKVDNHALRDVRHFINNLSDCMTFPVYRLESEQILQLFSYMVQSEIGFIRRISFYLRLFYTYALYDGPLGNHLTGMPSHGGEVAQYIKAMPPFYTHLYFNEKKQQFEGHIDSLIVGSGASSSVAANQLQQAGLKVVVVEKGPLVIPGAINTKDNYRFLDNKALKIAENGSIALLNASITGGGPTINLDMSFSPTLAYIRYRFDLWHRNGLIPEDLWTPLEIKNAYAWVKSIFEPRKVHHSEINANNALLYNGAKALNIPTKMFQLNTYEEGKSPHSILNKKTSFEALLLPAMKDQNNPLTLLANCSVKKVIIKHGKAVGVKCIYKNTDEGPGIVNDLYGFDIKDNTTIALYADHVILAAGNLGTSGILLNSKINNPNIGKGFVTHPLIPLMGRFDYPIMPHEGIPSSVFIDHFAKTNKNPDAPGFLIESAAGQPNLGAILMPGSPKQVLDNMDHVLNSGGIGVILIDEPNEKNRVEVACDGHLKVHYELSEEDRMRFKEGVKTAVNILLAAGAQNVTFHSYAKPLFENSIFESNTITPQTDVDLAFENFDIIKNQTLVLGAHMMGGNKIGMSPENSVVDSRYQVWGVDNLYVIDSSIFPTSVGANPMQTIYTVAKIFSDRFLKSLAEKQ